MFLFFLIFYFFFLYTIVHCFCWGLFFFFFLFLCCLMSPLCPSVLKPNFHPCFGQTQHGADLKSPLFGDVRGCLETLFQASTLQLREDWATPRVTKGGWKFKVEVRMGGVPSFYRNGKSRKWTSGCSENDNKSKLILTPSTNFGKFFWHSKVINTDQIYLLKCVNFIKQLTVLTREFVNRKTKAKYVKHS